MTHHERIAAILGVDPLCQGRVTEESVREISEAIGCGCTCCDVIGENPECAVHGEGTDWEREGSREPDAYHYSVDGWSHQEVRMVPRRPLPDGWIETPLFRARHD